jgi:CrcB protein
MILLSSILAISIGASLGAVLRWLFAGWFNALIPTLPLGTLLANLLGGYLIGVAIAFLAGNSAISPQWRLFVITGFLGGLTTFSTFSAEVVTNLIEKRLLWAIATVLTHVVGSVLMTLLGIATISLLRTQQLRGA